jgi:hypothetical protein
MLPFFFSTGAPPRLRSAAAAAAARCLPTPSAAPNSQENDCSGTASVGPTIKFAVPPSKEACIGVGNSESNTSWISKSCLAGWSPSSARQGVTLAQYDFLPNTTTCPLVSSFAANVYYDILPTCQLYPAGVDDNDYNYLSFQYSCNSNGQVQSTYYTGAFCTGSPISYPEQTCEFYYPSFYVFGCPAATGLSGGAIAGIAIATSVVGLAGLATVFSPAFRAGVASFVTKNPLFAASKGTGSTYESMPLASGKA